MGEPESIRAQWVAAASAGKSFAEVGGLWGTVNEQVTVAARAGATSTTMIDVEPSDDDLWRLFHERAASLGVTDTACVVGSIDDSETVRRVGSFDVVCCSGVVYHCPEPLRTLRHLRAITREILILGSATIPERVTSSAGSLSVEPGSALLVPAITESDRAVLGEWLREVGGSESLGVNYPLQTDWALDDYTAWWWFFTRDYVAALLRLVGFEIDAVSSEWGGRATLYRARSVSPAPAPVA